MNSIELTKDIILDDLGIFIKSINAIVFSDLHIGYEESLHKSGFLVPKFHFTDMKKRITSLIDKFSAENIIILGDIQHEFTKNSFKVNKQIRSLLDFYSANCKKLYIIKGNHEKVLSLNRLQNHVILDYFNLGKYFFCHGDKLFEDVVEYKKSSTIIIGHQHPSITIFDYTRKESFKCFLQGKYNKKTLIVLPSLNTVTIGIDILSEEIISPFIKDINKFKVYVVGKEIYDFGKVNSLKKKF
jgi:hypothetical protein